MAASIVYSLQYHNVTDIHEFFGKVLNTTALTPDGLQLSKWVANFSTLAFDPGKTNISVINQTIAQYFQSDRFSYPVQCILPMSGQYGFLPRLAFYALLIFGLVARKHEYLSTAALGTAMTYAATSCIHAFILLKSYTYRYTEVLPPPNAPLTEYGDPDLLAMLPILVSGSIMLVPILNWSQNVRNYRCQGVVLLWGLLMYTALVPASLKLYLGSNFWTSDSNVATCVIGPECGPKLIKHEFIRSQDFYDKCKCNDTCGTVTFPGAPLRSSAAGQAFLHSDSVIAIVNSDSEWRLYNINFIVLLLVTVHGVFGLLEINHTQADLRDQCYRFLYQDRQWRTWKPAHYAAKIAAACLFLAAFGIAVICPPLFVSSIVVLEILLRVWPSSEGADAVGQWSVWVSAALVLIAAIVNEYTRDLFPIIDGTTPKPPSHQLKHHHYEHLHSSIDPYKTKSYMQITHDILNAPYAALCESINDSWSRVRAEWMGNEGQNDNEPGKQGFMQWWHHTQFSPSVDQKPALAYQRVSSFGQYQVSLRPLNLRLSLAPLLTALSPAETPSTARLRTPMGGQDQDQDHLHTS